jgi:hypothetical protein
MMRSACSQVRAARGIGKARRKSYEVRDARNARDAEMHGVYNETMRDTRATKYEILEMYGV